MALLVADRVKETTTTTGTGTVDLAGVASGFIGFVAGIGNGNTCYYAIVGTTEWEVGIGTVTDLATDTLSRTTVLASSNANALVNFSAGTKDVFVTIPAGVIFTEEEVTTTSVTMRTNTNYVANNAGLVTLTLPTTAAVGKKVSVAGLGAGGWKIAQNASQLIRFGNQVTTTGTGGYLASSNQYDAVELRCVVANTTWSVISSQGNITYV